MFLITRPEYEVPTRYISKWAEFNIVLAKQKGHTVTDLQKEKAIRKNVESYLSKRGPRLVMFNGHGSNDRICGHDTEVLIQKGENEKMLESKIIYALACSSSKELGPSAVHNGATAYIGYDRPFFFVGDSNYISHPLEDPRARPFFESSNMVISSLLKDHTVSESVDKAKHAFLVEFKKLLTSEASPDDVNDAMALRWDMLSLTFSGTAEAKI